MIAGIHTNWHNKIAEIIIYICVNLDYKRVKSAKRARNRITNPKMLRKCIASFDVK